MKSNFFKLLYPGVISLVLAVACTNNPFPGYEKDAKGLYCKEYKVDVNADKPEIGDFLTLDLIYSNANDSILFNSKDMEGGFRIPVQEAGYPGDFFYRYPGHLFQNRLLHCPYL